MTVEELSKKARLTRFNVLVIENNEDKLLLSDKEQKPRNTGKVILVSKNVKDIKIGDNVFYSQAAGVYLTIDGIRYVLLSQREIFGFVDESLSENQFYVGNTGDLYKFAEDMQVFYGLTGNNLNLTGVSL